MGESSKWTKTQLGVFFVMILLSIDEVNPVKLILHMFPALQAWHVATLSASLMVYIFLSDIKNLLYSFVKVYFHSILSIFFRSVEIIGRENIPRYGPVIFTVNHANQFADAVMVATTCQRPVSYLMAEASWKRRVIGDMAWAMGVVPVRRAQDNAVQGSGTVRIVEAEDQDLFLVTGEGTKFTTEFKPSDKLRPPRTAFALKVKEIKSDSSMVVDGKGRPDDFPITKDAVTYDILKHTPLTEVFAKVVERLAGGGAVGIFPEGGSHDRTELLPLKIGISLIAYSALEKNDISVPIVPVGLSYFRAHRWRGRAVVEYGRPIFIDPSTLGDFSAGGDARRKVCSNLLEEVELSMRSVLVSAPDYETLELIHTARRLYQRKQQLDTSEKQDLSRRFAEGYKRLLLKGVPGPEWQALQARLSDYRNELKDLGLKDYQVLGLLEERLDQTPSSMEEVDGDNVLMSLQLAYNIFHKLILIAVSAIPVVFLNLPIGVLAGWYAERRRVKALKKSKVKIKAYDVMLTEKVVFCTVMVPTLWMLYGLLLSTRLEGATVSLIMLSMPAFAYIGIVVVESGIIDWKDLRPHFMRISPSSRQRLAKLPLVRKQLQDDLRAFIRTLGPELGDIYYGKDVDWTKVQAEHVQRAEPKKTI